MLWIVGSLGASAADRPNVLLITADDMSWDSLGCTEEDPGCLNNLAENPEYSSLLKEFRMRMEKVLLETDDHELENYRNLNLTLRVVVGVGLADFS